MNIDKKTKQSSKIITSMTDSISSVGKYSLKETQLLHKLSTPMSTKLINQFMNPPYRSHVEEKTKTLKIKKYQSIETNTTEEFALMAQEAKFLNSYKDDIFFRKKVELLIKQHEKRMKQRQEKQISSSSNNALRNNTLRSKKNSNDIQLLEMYQRCKKWISKFQQSK